MKRGDAGSTARLPSSSRFRNSPAPIPCKLTNAIESALAELKRGLPSGISANQILFRQANFISTSIGNVKNVLVEAAIVVAVILFLFLLNVRTTFISLTAIPISILITVLVFKAFGMSINTMTLGGLAIAIGELVDDAVVDVENIYRRLGENRRAGNPRPVLEVVATASHEVRSGIVYATFIIILVFVPLFALSGIEGRLFAPLGVAYIVSILASLSRFDHRHARALVLSAAPAESGWRSTTAGSSAGSRPAMRGCWHGHSPARAPCSSARRSRGRVAAAAVSACRDAFLPPFNEGTLTISMVLNPGISLAEVNRVGLDRRKLLISGCRRSSRSAAAPAAPSSTSMPKASIPARSTWTSMRSGRIGRGPLADVRARLTALPANVNIGQPISHRLDHMLSGVRAQIALKVYGEDLDTLRSLAGQLQREASGIPGLVDLQIEKQVRIPQVQVVIDYERAALYGVTPAMATEALESLSNGRVVSRDRRWNAALRRRAAPVGRVIAPPAACRTCWSKPRRAGFRSA